MARIRLALLDKDVIYLQRTIAAFERSYHEKIEAHSFSDQRTLEEFFQEDYVDILLVGDHFEINQSWHERATVIAELTEVWEKAHSNAICKYQKIDAFYKTILSLQADAVDNNSCHVQHELTDTPLVAIASAGSGSGATSVAIALCKHLALSGKKALYVNLEDHGVLQPFIFSETNRSLSDVLFALKSKKGNISLKLESTIEQDDAGFYYINVCHSVADLMQLDDMEWAELLQELKQCSLFDVIILDVTFSNWEKIKRLLQSVTKFLLVSTQSVLTAKKLAKQYELVQFHQQKSDSDFLGKMGLIVNKSLDSVQQDALFPAGIRPFGQLPLLPISNEKEMVNAMATEPEMSRICARLIEAIST